jgi:hypothetical protein
VEVPQDRRLAELTLHQTLFDHLAELLHLILWQVVALLCLFEPLSKAGSLAQFRWARLRDIWGWHLRLKLWMRLRFGRSNDGSIISAVYIFAWGSRLDWM